MESILTPGEKKYLKFFVKFLQSYGEKTGTFRIEEFHDGIDEDDLEHLEENYYLEVPHEIKPIIGKILEYSSKRLPDVDEDISYSTLDVVIDCEDQSITAEYCWRFYTVDEQYNTFEGEDYKLDKIIDELEQDGQTGKIFVSFDGSGDSGSIEQAEDESGNTVNLIPDVEDWCYNILEGQYGGWEINEGSRGKFMFDIENRTCELEFGWNNENTECDTVYEEKFDN